MTNLYVLRHGETDWNKQNRTQGCGNDLPLSEVGRHQAICASRRIKMLGIDAIYCSDLKRAVETATEVAKATSLPINETPGLREMNFGCWEGLTFDEIKKKYSDIYEVWRSSPIQTSIPDGETLLELKKRVLDTIDDIISKHEGENILIVSHGIALKILILSILGMDLSLLGRLRLDNTSLSIIEYRDNGPVLTLLNDTCHLNAGGKLK